MNTHHVIIAALDPSYLGLTIAAALALGLTIIGLVRPGAEKKTHDAAGLNEEARIERRRTRPARPGDAQAGFGALLVALGVAGGLATFIFYQVGRDGIYNLSLAAERNIILATCAFAILIGVLLIGFAQMRRRD